MLLKYGLLAFAYLLGAIPFSIILGKKFMDIDIREHGSGNPGGTNSLRFLGKKIGISVLILDGLKAGIIIILIKFGVFGDADLLHPLAYGVAAAFGHVYSIYIKFKGGKAVAATVGMMIAYNFVYAIIMMTIFMIVLKIWKYVSVASTSAVATGVGIGLLVGLTGHNLTITGIHEVTEDIWGMAMFMTLLLLLVAYRHKKNFNNITQGIEPKVKWI